MCGQKNNGTVMRFKNAIKARLFDPRQRQRIFALASVHTSREAHPASYPKGTRVPFPGSKARSGRDADHSLPSSNVVKNE
jgi:hypothetical protein